jgi:hypothetical protein
MVLRQVPYHRQQPIELGAGLALPGFGAGALDISAGKWSARHWWAALLWISHVLRRLDSEAEAWPGAN